MKNKNNKAKQDDLFHKLNDTFPQEEIIKYKPKQTKQVIKKNQTKKKEEK